MLQRTALLWSLVLAVGAVGASAQGTFGHLAYGAGWQTTFLLVNQDQTTDAEVTLSFYSDFGAPLTAPVSGANPTSAYSLVIPAGGSASVVLAKSGTASVTEGWASLSVNNSPSVSGQAIFRQTPGEGHPVLEAAVPFSSGAPACLVPYGTASLTHYILIPFDNTANVHVTALALANTTAATFSVPIEFDDASGAVITTDTLQLAGMNHIAFVSSDKYRATGGKTGVVRITLPGSPNSGDLSVLALLGNSVTGTLTTLMPILQ